MRKTLAAFIVGILFLSACSSNQIRNAGKGIEVTGLWARSGMKDGNSAAYMMLTNLSNEDDELIGVSSDAARAVEIHLSRMKADGTMEMIPQESIPLSAGVEVELEPGGYHVMLIGLNQELKVGDEISLTLHFKNREDIILKVPVMDEGSMDGD